MSNGILNALMRDSRALKLRVFSYVFGIPAYVLHIYVFAEGF